MSQYLGQICHVTQYFQEPDDNSDSSDADEMFYDTSSEKPDLIGHGPRCRARFDFDGEGPEDLVFEDGDVIKLLERVGPEWRKGELNGKVGLFPLSFVEVIEDLPADGATDERSKVVKAMFDYDGLGDELSFQVKLDDQTFLCRHSIRQNLFTNSLYDKIHYNLTGRNASLKR